MEAVALAVDLVKDDAEIIVSFCPVCWRVQGRALSKRGVYRRGCLRVGLDMGVACPGCGSTVGSAAPENDMYCH